MRLDKLLGQEGFGSRNQVKKLIRSRQVRVDGVIVSKDSLNVDPSLQEVLVAGRRLRSGSVYYLLHKPAGLVTARTDAQHQTVLDLLASTDRRPNLYPIGRLDRDTTGLILVTDNGPLGYRLLHPSRHVTKTYEVTVNGLLKADAVDFFREGVSFLDGTVCQPAQLELISSSQSQSRALLTLSEGKFHQVKKMFLAYGLKVIQLKRIAFAGFHLGDLPEGAYRPLSQSEKENLKAFLD